MDRLQTASLLCFRSRSSFNCRDICCFTTCCFVLAQFYSLDLRFFFFLKMLNGDAATRVQDQNEDILTTLLGASQVFSALR